MLGFFVSAPLPIFNRNQGEIARAQADQERTRQSAAAVDIDVNTEVASAFREYESSRRLLLEIEQDLLEPARSARAGTTYTYQAGATSLLDVLDAQRAFNDTMLKWISTVPGVARAFVDRGGQVPQLRIEIDRARAARYGLNVADVEDVIETALGGKTATELWEGERRFTVVVRLADEERRSAEAIRSVLIDTPTGLRIPMSEVATVSVGSGSMNIARESGTRVAAIGVFIQNRDMGSVVADMKRAVAAHVPLPTGYYLRWGGEFENQERAMARLSLIVPISILLIFVLLFNAFGSVKHSALILLNVPFALIGGILALYLTGIHLSVSAAIGFIALFGQAVLNGVVMVSYFNQLRRTGVGAHEAAVRGSIVRLRTVLMTTLLAMLGLTPMALSHSIGSEVQRPLATVIIGGLFSAAILTLIVLPALYVTVERHTHDISEGRLQSAD